METKQNMRFRLALLAASLGMVVSGTVPAGCDGQPQESISGQGTAVGSNEQTVALTPEPMRLVALPAPVAMPMAQPPSGSLGSASSATADSALASLVSSTGVTLSPATASSAGSSTMVTVTGSGFTANASVKVYWDSTTLKTTVTASSAGAFTATLTVPAPIDGGVYPIIATDSSGVSAMVNMTLYDPSLSLSTSSAVPSSSVTVTGSHFNASKSLTLQWDQSSTLATVTTDSSGAFSTSITVPTATGGSHTICVVDNNQAPIVSFTVSGTVSVTTTSATYGTAIPFTGSGFSGSSAVTVSVTGKVSGATTTAGSFTSGNSGTLASSFTMPQVDLGYYTVQAADSAGSATAAQTIGVNLYGTTTSNRSCASWFWENDKLTISVSGIQPSHSATVTLSGGYSGTYTISVDSSGNGSWSKTWSYHKMPSINISVNQTGSNGYTGGWTGSVNAC